MQTQCPACKATFDINLQQLRAKRGAATCPNCQTIFSATLAPPHPRRVADADSTVNHRAKKPNTGGTHDAMRMPLPSRTHSSYAGLRGWDEKGIDKNSGLLGSFSWGLGSLLLLGLLIFQLGVLEGGRLSQNEYIRPWLDVVCEKLHCRLEEYRNIERIRVVEQELQPAPSDIDGLTLNLIIANQSSLAQAFPSIKLVLKEPTGRAFASRVFKPDEYLSEGQPALMLVAKPYEIHLLLAKPSSEVGGFSVELL